MPLSSDRSASDRAEVGSEDWTSVPTVVVARELEAEQESEMVAWLVSVASPVD